MKPLHLDPRTKLALIPLSVLSAMFAPNLRFQLALVAPIGLLAAAGGQWRYALRSIAAYALGKLIFVVTHDYEFVCRSCTRVLHLDGGGLRADLALSEETLPEIRRIFDMR